MRNLVPFCLSRLALVTPLAACVASAGSGSNEPVESTASSIVAGANAAGAIPASLPARLTVGLGEQKGDTWMKSSGVRWDARYMYLTEGWLNNWGWGNADGQFALDYMNECDAAGFTPVLELYVMNGLAPAYDESQFYSKTQNASLMASYFNEFKVLMQRVKQFGKPVVVLLEADGFGFLEQQSQGNANAYAAVAASGMSELAPLPNTVAGWGLSFLQLRKSVGASNAILAPHVSAWGTGVDVMSTSGATASLSDEVNKGYAFLAPFGLAANATGATYDLLVTDPLDRDADYYRLTQNVNRWWDATDTAPTSAPSFNRYASWLQLWNQKTQKRIVLWQIPVGNSNSANVANTGQARGGYKDNRAEYFFGTESATHLAQFADAGVIELLYGAGASGQATPVTDQLTDGQPYLKTHAGALLASGGFSIGRGGSTTTSDAGAPPPSDAGTPPPNDSAQYGFEANAQGWVTSGAPITSVASSNAKAFAGARSLAVTFNGAAGSQEAYVASPSTPAGKTVTFHVWCPSGSAVSAVQPFVLQGASGNWAWTGNWQAMSSLKAGAWNTLTVTVPSNAAPLDQLGVQLTTNATWSGACYVDSVAW